ncbi:SNF2 family N-terminal domain-containing protein 5 [Elsinoe australis]|uniref:SNF2 family N-terminal domain-containing protein 5 n=1 Tax=Elsinoe australis TaxID=40998 RepID=A0A4U7B0N8_9PEZI|nr:SNF2 family N-terminal domain-containing protein 5 [Elsinoe australis]
MQVSSSTFPNTPRSMSCDSSIDESLYSTPRATPKKTGITALHSTSPWHQDQARCFLQNLNNFIPLGCLVGQGSSSTHADAEQWTEVFQIPWAARLDAWAATLEDFISAGWIRVFVTSGLPGSSRTIFRIYILAADAGHRFIQRYDKAARSRYPMWRSLVEAVDTSPDLWDGLSTEQVPRPFEMWAAADAESLFWMFNNIPSPSPDPNEVDNIFRKQALTDILDPSMNLKGFRTKLYPYQRRSAGLMLQRESESRLYLDPRFEMRIAPDGSKYYYNPRDFAFHRQPMRYEAGKGGILAETMGLGKTVMTLALVVSTLGFIPKVPVEYSQTKPRKTVGRLVDMCIAAAHRFSIPWKTLLDDNQTEATSIKQLKNSVFSYEIPQIPIRLNRTTTIPPPKIKTMAATTIVVVPRNLCSQWQSEIEKHVEPGVLNILVMEDLKKDLPSADDLRKYDLILFSRNRFEQESRDGSDEQGRRFSKTPLACNCPYIGATRTRDCTCLRTDDLYSSPLKDLHFLRVIIDEGHSFSSTNSLAALVAERLVTADHRWVVSGTPAKDLLGVEMDIFSTDHDLTDMSEEEQRAAVLDQRKGFNAKEDTQGAVKSLGSLISHFLQIKPWSSGQGERGALWEEYIYRHEDPRKKTYTAFSKALRQTLEAVVIKTRPEDVERDIELPTLTYETVKLEPSFYDKITANLFTLVLTSNAVTSERTDRDYLFHKESAKARFELISNLRRSAFFWTGFSEDDVTNAIKNGGTYLAKDNIKCSQEDRTLLEECIRDAKAILACQGWKGMSMTHEMGLFIKDWPQNSAEHWTLDGTNPMLTGATQISEAQDYVHSRLGLDEPDANLTGEGIKAMVRARTRGRQETDSAKSTSKNGLVKPGVPSSSVNGEPSKKRSSPTKRSKAKPQTPDPNISEEGPPRKRRRTTHPSSPATDPITTSPTVPPEPPPTLPSSSPLHQTHLLGTASAKTSHLLSEILAHHQTEKILVFYTSTNSAFYLAQCLEILHIPHLIYARTLPAATKSSYIVRFNDLTTERVMLMDVAQAAFGLNLSSASRVYFINPVCRPGVEAQAVKRAHRIGQTREVKVQTLVLKGTVEEGMWERSRRMSRDEHRGVKVLEEDEGVKGVVMGARLLELGEMGKGGEAKVALLKVPQTVFFREGWERWGDGKWVKKRRGSVDGKGEAEKSEKLTVETKKGKRKRGDEGSASPVKEEIKVEVKALEGPKKKKKAVGFALAEAPGAGSSAGTGSPSQSSVAFASTETRMDVDSQAILKAEAVSTEPVSAGKSAVKEVVSSLFGG